MDDLKPTFGFVTRIYIEKMVGDVFEILTSALLVLLHSLPTSGNPKAGSRLTLITDGFEKYQKRFGEGISAHIMVYVNIP